MTFARSKTVSEKKPRKEDWKRESKEELKKQLIKKYFPRDNDNIEEQDTDDTKSGG